MQLIFWGVLILGAYAVLAQSRLAAEGMYCQTNSREKGVCSKESTCTTNTEPESSESDGAGLLDMRSLMFTGKQCKEGLVCCKQPTQPSIAPRPTQAVDNPMLRRNRKQRRCGWINRNGVDNQRAQVGHARLGEFPWTVNINLIVNSGDIPTVRYIATGSLIHSRVVLTAAHIIRDIANQSDLAVAIADHDLQQKILDRVLIKVESVKSHEYFNPTNLANDVALLVLKNQAPYRSYLSYACLPPPSTRPASNSKCFVSGWDDDSSSSVMAKVEASVIADDTCQSMLQRSSLGEAFQLDNSFVCTMNPGMVSCSTGVGSPLVCPIPDQQGRFVQSGVVSWGGSYGDGIPAVYTDISYMRSWIDNKMAELNYDISSYTDY